MSDALKLQVAGLLFAFCLPAQSVAPEEGAKVVVLQRNEGELRTHRPREGKASPSSDFFGRSVGRPIARSIFFSEEIPPGAVIPKHKHHGEDESLLIQTGSAHVWLGNNEYDAEPGALVFIPAGTWIGLKNTGKESSLIFVWNEPGFEEMKNKWGTVQFWGFSLLYQP